MKDKIKKQKRLFVNLAIQFHVKTHLDLCLIQKKKLLSSTLAIILNSYNAGFILGWRANIDFCSVINKEAVLAYVAKYASKGETSSPTYGQVLQTAISKLNDSDQAGIAYQKMLSTFTAERDISSQETCHILLGCQLVKSSQQHQNLCVSPDVQEEINFETTSKFQAGIFQKY